MKGHRYILRAVDTLRREGVALSLKIVGEGEERTGLEAEVKKLGLESYVVFTGALFGAELRDQLAASDIFVLASHSEGLPVSMLEAMATGLCVVVPAVTGIPEMVRDGQNGLLFTPQDPVDLAEKLRHAAGDAGLRRRLGKEARTSVVSRCSGDAVYREILRAVGGVKE